MPEHIDVKMLRPNTMHSWIRCNRLMRSFQKMVSGMIARLASAKVKKAVVISQSSAKISDELAYIR
jgi:hypothetical protein